jgi:hypothetical protein
MTFTRAIKRNAKLRLALAGIAGSGKTYTALTLATALAKGQPIALIDTEHGSASKYADIFCFDAQELSRFDPRTYINAIHEAEEAGYAVLIIDSLSHAWNGTGGALELVETITRYNQKNNSFNAWGEVTPLQNKLIDTILASSIHIIATMRTKTEYVIEQVNGKSVPRKVGMAPIQRADVEYEFDIYADMDASNTMIIQKSRCSALYGQVIAKPSGTLAEVIQTWLAGEPLPLTQTAQASEVPTQEEPGLGEPVRAQLNDLYARAKRLSLVASREQFVNYIRRLLVDPHFDLKRITLAQLATVSDDLAAQEVVQQTQAGDLEKVAS